MSDELKSIKEANLAKRLIAVIMDGALFSFIFFFFITLVFTPIANKAFDYENMQAQELAYAVNSKLYAVEVNKEIIEPTELKTSIFDVYPISDYKDKEVDFYISRVKYYYLNYKTGVDVSVPAEKNAEDYRSPDYNVEIKDENGNLVLPKDYYTEDWFNALTSSITTMEEARELAKDAIKDFSNSLYIRDIESKLSKTQVFVIVPSFVLSYSIFFIAIPLIFKNGETLGKKTFNIGFVTKDGYNVKKRQIVSRQLLLFLYVSLFTFVVGFEITTCVATLCLGVSIYFIATAISKTKRSFVDYFAYTYLIDTRASVWFSSPEEEAQKVQVVEENVAKLKVEEEPLKNVIQIGGEIIDEDAKREFLEEQEKAKKNKKS